MPDIPDKAAFLALPHRLRAPALVGTFMQYWAAMEMGVDAAIAKGLGLTGNQSYLLAPNISFIPKTHILKAVIHLAGVQWDSPFFETQKAHFNSLVNEIAGASGVRNTFAHYIFAESEKSDGVQFVVVQAKGKLKFPEEEWSIQRFLDFFAKLKRWDKELRELEAWLEPTNLNALEAFSTLHALGYGPFPTEPSIW